VGRERVGTAFPLLFTFCFKMSFKLFQNVNFLDSFSHLFVSTTSLLILASKLAKLKFPKKSFPPPVWGLLKSLSVVEITSKVGLHRKWLGEVPANIGECDFTSRNFSSTIKAMVKPVPYVIITDSQTFRSSAVSLFRKFWGKSS